MPIEGQECRANHALQIFRNLPPGCENSAALFPSAYCYPKTKEKRNNLMPQRTSIYLKGFAHKNPIPNACRIGNLLMSGIILGMDPETGKVAETIERQCELMFMHVKDTVEQAGGSIDDILKMTVWLKDRNQREPINVEWLKMFPDPRNRPARQAMSMPDLANGVLVQCDIVAVIT